MAYRRAHDNRWYTEAQFHEYYQEAGSLMWRAAQCAWSPSVHNQTASSDATERESEMWRTAHCGETLPVHNQSASSGATERADTAGHATEHVAVPGTETRSDPAPKLPMTAFQHAYAGGKQHGLRYAPPPPGYDMGQVISDPRATTKHSGPPLQRPPPKASTPASSPAAHSPIPRPYGYSSSSTEPAHPPMPPPYGRSCQADLPPPPPPRQPPLEQMQEAMQSVPAERAARESNAIAQEHGTFSGRP